MSLLLDALNKADQERKRKQGAPGINSNHEGYFEQQERKPYLLILLLSGIILVLVGAGLFYWYKSQSPIPSEKPIKGKVHKERALKEKTVKKVTPVTATKNAQAGSSLAASSATNESAEEENQDLSDDSIDENVASLYQQQNAVVSTQIRQLELPQSPAPVTAATSPDVPAADATATTPPAQTSINQFANLPYIQDLPRPILDRIPTLSYTQHNFNGITGNVIINGVVRHADDQLGNGLVIDKILEDGMILHIDNFSFKIKALNSWVNM